MKIAVAASGLAHIKRGVETWAQDLGVALRRVGVDATTFQGSADANAPNGVVVPCLRRYEPWTARVVKAFLGKGGWRIGLGSEYEVEQTTFALNLFWRIRKDFDILHVQDPRVALILGGLHRRGLSRPKVILAHGTEEDVPLLQAYSYLQHLAPNYLEHWEEHRPTGQMAFAIPNFVDLERFAPALTAEDKRKARADCGLPDDTLVVLSVGALKKHHKRMDHLLREFAVWEASYPGKALLVIAGAREVETDEVIHLGRELLGDKVLFLESAPRARVAQLLKAADIFTLASLHEMMPIAVLEALASGLPVACNDTETLRWMVGAAGRLTDIREPGALAAQFARLADAGERERMSQAARRQAEDTFSERVVVEQILAMYRQVLGR